jgi:hypothetical protein
MLLDDFKGLKPYFSVLKFDLEVQDIGIDWRTTFLELRNGT